MKQQLIKYLEEFDNREIYEIYQILYEYQRAKRKFPEWPKDIIHAAAIVGEESGELIQATIESVYEPNKNENSPRTESIQTAAMGLRFLVNDYKTEQRYETDNINS